MAVRNYIFSIYKTFDDSPKYFVLRTALPAFRNSSQIEEDRSWKAESAQRSQMLELIGKKIGNDEFELVGEFHGDPEGDIFYSESGASGILVYYMQTDFGKPWIIFGTADSEEEFLAAVENDEDMRTLNPIGKPIKVEARFVIPNDF